MDIDFLAKLARWEETVSPAETGDPLWKLHAYRVARYLLDCSLSDLERATPTVHAATADQLRRAAASVSANVSEGFSRRTPNDRARFYAYALGSIRETMVWYTAVRAHLPPGRLQERLDEVAQLRRLILGLHANVSRSGGSR
jgi:four helix bundle protein